MDKLIEMLGKILKPLLSSKTLWTIIVAVAIFSLAYLVIFDNGGFLPSRSWAVAAAFVSLSLILARVVIWVVGRVRDQYFT